MQGGVAAAEIAQFVGELGGVPIADEFADTIEPRGVAVLLEESAQRRGGHMAQDDFGVLNANQRRTSAALNQVLFGIFVVVQVVGAAAAVGQREPRSAIAAARAPYPLRVVERLRRHIPKEHHVQFAKIHAYLKCGG